MPVVQVKVGVFFLQVDFFHENGPGRMGKLVVAVVQVGLQEEIHVLVKYLYNFNIYCF